MGLAIFLLIAGIVIAVLSAGIALADDNPALMLGFVLGVVMFFVGLGLTANESDKNYCLKTLPQISQTETKWLDGECYMKAKDGKFVPQEWIEKGYNK